MWPDRVSNPGHLALESDALPTALRSPAPVRRSFANTQVSHNVAQLLNSTDKLYKSRPFTFSGICLRLRFNMTFF